MRPMCRKMPLSTPHSQESQGIKGSFKLIKIGKETSNPDGTTAYVFYSEGKEIAKQTVDAAGNIIKWLLS